MPRNSAMFPLMTPLRGPLLVTIAGVLALGPLPEWTFFTFLVNADKGPALATAAAPSVIADAVTRASISWTALRKRATGAYMAIPPPRGLLRVGATSLGGLRVIRKALRSPNRERTPCDGVEK